MKVLGLNIYFKLADNFDGGLTEALEEYVKYRKEKGLPKVPPLAVKNVHKEDIWDQFLKDIAKGNRVSGHFVLCEHDEESDTWAELE